MTPILYEKDEIDFTSQGLGALAEIYDVDVAEQRNGLFQLTANYPVTGIRYDDISVGRIILAKPNQRDEPHAFRIVNTELDVMGYSLMIEADSITYDLNHNFIKHLTVNDATGQVMMSALQSAIVNPSIFTFYSDITHKSSTALNYVNPMEAVMGVQGSFLQYWGGELKRENRRIAMFNRRGRDNVATFRLGKNISGLKYKVDISTLVTRIMPVKSVQENDKTTYLEGTPVSSKYINNYEQIYTIKVDFTDDTIKTVDDLNKAAEGWFVDSANTGRDKPSVTIDIDVLSLQDSADYQDKFKNLESVALTDTVTVYVPEYGVNVTAIVNEIHFDPIQERVTKLVVGTAKQSFADSSRVQLSDLQGKIISVQEQADQIAVSANNKNSNYYGSVAPSHPQEGDFWYWKNGDLSGIKQFVDGEWVGLVDSNTQQVIKDSVNKAVSDAKTYSDQAIANNREQIDNQIQTINDKTAQLKNEQVEFDRKAQGYANQALADAKVDVQKTSQELVASIQKETADRAAAVTALDTKAKEYADKAKTDAINAGNAAVNKETTDRVAAITALDAKATTAINQAKNDAQSAVNALQIGGRNLVVTGKLVRGWMSAGDIGVSSTHGMVTDYISVSPNSELVAQIWYDNTSFDATNNYLRVAFFDADKNYLTRTPIAGSDSTTYNKWLITTPANAAFLRMSFDWLGDGYGHAKLEKGNKATDYTPAPEDVVQDYTNKDNVIKQSLTQYQEANDGRVTKAQSEVTQALNMLGTKVSQTTFDQKTGDLETKYTNVKQTADKATTDIVEIKKTDATQDSKINSVQSDVNSTKQSISAIQTIQDSQSKKINEIVTDVNGTKQSITDIQTKDGQQDTRMGTIETNVSGVSTSFSEYKTTNDDKVSTVQSTATQALNEVATKVSKTDYDKKTGQLQTDLNTTTTTANQAKTDIVSIKQKNDSQDARMLSIENDANGTNTTVSSLQTTQGQQASAITTLQQRANGFDATVTKVNNMSVGGRNLLVMTNTSKGWLDMNYNISPSGDASLASEFIPVTPNTDYVAQQWYDAPHTAGAGYLRYAFYDSSKKPISRVPAPANNSTTYSKWNITTPANAAYIRMSFDYIVNGESRAKFEKGNMATDWSPASEDLEGATAKAQLTADNAMLNINSYKSDADGRITKAQADIRANATAINSKVSRTEYDTKTGQIDNQISEVDQKANEITQTVTNVQGQVNDLKQVNMVTNSEFSPDLAGWYIRGTASLLKTPDSSDVGYGSSGHVVLDTTNGTGVGNVMFTSAPYPVAPSSIISVSVELKASVSGTNPYIGFIYYDANKVAIAGQRGGVPVTTDYKLWKYTGTAIPATAKYVSFDILISNAYKVKYVMSQPMMVVGSKVGVYVTGQYINNDKIATQQITIDGITESVSKHTADIASVTSRVQTAEGTITTTKDEVDGLQSKQTQTAKQLTTEISDRQKGDTNTLIQAKDFTTNSISNYNTGMQSQLTQTSDAVLAKISAIGIRYIRINGQGNENNNGTHFMRISLLDTAGKDLLAGKTATAVGGAVGGNGGNGATDNNANTYLSMSPEPNGSNYLFYDLGAVTYTPQKMEIKMWTNYRTYKSVMVQVSPDGKSWRTVFLENVKAITGDINKADTSFNLGNTSSATVLTLLKDNWSIGITDNAGKLASGVFGDINGMTLNGKTVTINANQTVITGTAFITDAMISTMSASKLTAGTIDASNINVTNINASNIVSGAISGANLNINLNTGQVVFQRGRIYNASVEATDYTKGGIDINIDKRYLASSNGSNVAMLYDGKLSLIQEGFFTGPTSIPYFEISNHGGGFDFDGAALTATEKLLLTTKGDVGSLGLIDGRYLNGLIINKKQPTRLGGLGNGVIISGGQGYSDLHNIFGYAPHILVGVDQGAQSTAEIHMYSSWIRASAVEERTTSSGANVYVASDGTLVRSSSSSKYKLDIEYERQADTANKLLTLDPATWHDKFESEQLDKFHEIGVDPERAIDMSNRRYYGIIAEDLVKAGLEHLVSRNVMTGEVEGVEYSKIGVALIPIIRELRNRLNEQYVEIERLKEKFNE